MSGAEKVRLEVNGGAATLSICRPEAKNALSREIVDQMDALLNQVAADPAIKVLVVKSEGDFAAGADIRQMAECTPEQAKEMAAHADGVIVGSAIVKLCAKYGRDCVPYIKDYVANMKDAIR